MNIDSKSAALGAVAAIALAASLSWSQQSTGAPINQEGLIQRSALLTAFFNKPIQVAGIPTPQQMMRVMEGTPFVVPAGKLFVVTGMGSAQNPDNIFQVGVHINDLPIIEGHTANRNSNQQLTGAGPAVIIVPPGIVAGPGDVVSVNGTGGNGIVLGYLVNA